MNPLFPQLAGLRVFVVEDEFAVLLMIEDMVGDLGCELAGSASRVAQALDFLRGRVPDAAILDVNIAGEPVYPVAEALAARNVPFVFSTGYGESNVRANWRDRPIVQKPYVIEQLGAALVRSIRRNPAPTADASSTRGV